jgi:hypothetical protein
MICAYCEFDEHWRCEDIESSRGVVTECRCLHSEDAARLYSRAAALWSAISAGDLAAVAKQSRAILEIAKPKKLELVRR